MAPVTSPERTQVTRVHLLTAAGLLFGLAAIYTAAVAPPELAFRFAGDLYPRWVSPGYPAALIPPGKLDQTLTLAGVAILALTLGWHLSKLLARPVTPRSDGRIFAVAMPLTGALLGGFVYFFGNRQFGGCDQSLAIEVGWRQFIGQQPYRDFICTLPVGFYLPPAWAFKFLGLSWSSLTLMTAAFAVVMFVWQALLLRRLLGSSSVSILLAATFQVLAVGVASFWWYNPLTTAAGVTFVLAALLFHREPGRWPVLVSYGLALVVLASAKPNVATILIGGTTLVFLTSREHRSRMLLTSAAAFGVFVGILALNGISLADLLGSYLSIAARATPSPFRSFFDVNTIERTQALSAVLLALSPLLLLQRTRDTTVPRRWRAGAILALSAVAGVYAIVAHGELKYLDLPFLLVATALPVLIHTGAEDIRRWTITVALTLLVLGCTLGAMRHRIEKIGFGAYFEWELTEVAPPNAFFSSLRTGPRFVRTVAEVDHLLSRYRGATVFFGPRLEGFYAAFGKPSPKGLPPLLWHRGTFHPEAREPEIIRNFREARYDILVFAYRDFTYLPPEFAEVVSKEYVMSPAVGQQYPDLTVFFRSASFGGRGSTPAEL